MSIKLTQFLEPYETEQKNKGETTSSEIAYKTRNADKYDLRPIDKRAGDNYDAVKMRYGPLAGTDPDRKVSVRKNSRFVMSPMSKSALFLDDEEKRAVEEQVAKRVQEIIEQAKKDGFSQGIEEGRKAGHDEAFKVYREEGRARAEKVEDFLHNADRAAQQIFAQNENFILEIIFQICRMVILRELKTDRDYVVRLAKELIERVGVRNNITVKIHPSEKESIDMLKDGLMKFMSDLKNVNVEISDRVATGGCIVETEWSHIDASIETQISALADALLNKGTDQQS